MSCRSFAKPSIQPGSPQVYREVQRLIGIAGGRLCFRGAIFGNRLRDGSGAGSNEKRVVFTATVGEDESGRKLLSTCSSAELKSCVLGKLTLSVDAVIEEDAVDAC